jgi:cell division protein FtsL
MARVLGLLLLVIILLVAASIVVMVPKIHEMQNEASLLREQLWEL